jgi:hypothetical protein
MFTKFTIAFKEYTVCHFIDRWKYLEQNSGTAAVILSGSKTIFMVRIWRQYAPLKRRSTSTWQHGATCQKTLNFEINKLASTLSWYTTSTR